MRTLVASLALLTLAVENSKLPTLDLPPELAAYRSWRTVHHDPQPVPLELWLRCSLVPEDLVRAEKATGPHFYRYSHTYLNPTALETLSGEGTRAFSAGAIVAKAKFTDAAASRVEGVAFMIKHSAGEFTASGGWEFRYYPTQASSGVTHCIECHREGNSRDYIFARLPRADSPF
jgi:cytochrome c553